jgi:hypothetical protein
MYLRQSPHCRARGSAVSVLVGVFVEDAEAIGAAELLAAIVGFTEPLGPALADKEPAPRAEDAGVRVFAETVVVVDRDAEAVNVVVVVDETLAITVFVEETEKGGEREDVLARDPEAPAEAEAVTSRAVPEGETVGAALRDGDDDDAREGLERIVQVGATEKEVDRERVLAKESEAPMDAEEKTDREPAREKVAPWLTEAIGAVPEKVTAALGESSGEHVRVERGEPLFDVEV